MAEDFPKHVFEDIRGSDFEKYNKNLFSKNRCGIFSCSNPKLLFKSRKKYHNLYNFPKKISILIFYCLCLSALVHPTKLQYLEHKKLNKQ